MLALKPGELVGLGQDLLEKFLETSMVVRIAPFSLRRALNFFKQSTVSCLRENIISKTTIMIQHSERKKSEMIFEPVEHAGHSLPLADPRVLEGLQIWLW